MSEVEKRGNRITSFQTVMFVIMVWVVSLCWALPPLFGWSRYVLEGYGTTCSYDYLSQDDHDKYFLISVILGDFILPLLIILFCYVQIILKFKSHQREFQTILSQNGNSCAGSEDSSVSVSSISTFSRRQGSTDTAKARHLKDNFIRTRKLWSKTEYRIAKTVFIVIAVYIMSWSPYATVCIVGQYGDASMITPTVAMVPIIIAKLSTIYNPFIYAISHPKFNSAIKKTFPTLFSLFCCCCDKNNKSRATSTSKKMSGPQNFCMVKRGSQISLGSEDGLNNSVISEAGDKNYSLVVEGEVIPAEFLMQLLKKTAKSNPHGRVTMTFKGGSGPAKIVYGKSNRRGSISEDESDAV